MHGDVFDIEPTGFNVVYLDPPYAPLRYDNCYIKRYHFLEGLAVYWRGQTILEHTRTKKLAKRYTPFSYKHTVVDALRTTFKRFEASTIVLSYSSNAVPDAETIERYCVRSRAWSRSERSTTATTLERTRRLNAVKRPSTSSSADEPGPSAIRRVRRIGQASSTSHLIPQSRRRRARRSKRSPRTWRVCRESTETCWRRSSKISLTGSRCSVSRLDRPANAQCPCRHAHRERQLLAGRQGNTPPPPPHP